MLRQTTCSKVTVVRCLAKDEKIRFGQACVHVMDKLVSTVAETAAVPG